MPPSNRSFRAAAVQMSSSPDKAANLAIADRLVKQAALDGAELVVLPEYYNCLGRMEDVIAQAEPIPGPSTEAAAALADRLGIWLVAGSICEQPSAAGKARNTSLVFDSNGNEVARYRKIHLFNIDLPDVLTFCESEWIEPGDEPIVVDTPLGAMGLATCYDLRFPELFRVLADRKMEFLAFPSAFAETTGRAHWEILLRARAIENQVHIVASNQATRQEPHLVTHGHSMIIDPWGEVLASATNESARIVAGEINRDRLREVRRNLPALDGRRTAFRAAGERV